MDLYISIALALRAVLISPERGSERVLSVAHASRVYLYPVRIRGVYSGAYARDRFPARVCVYFPRNTRVDRYPPKGYPQGLSTSYPQPLRLGLRGYPQPICPFCVYFFIY